MQRISVHKYKSLIEHHAEKYSLHAIKREQNINKSLPIYLYLTGETKICGGNSENKKV